MREVVIASAVRTALGSFGDFPPDSMRVFRIKVSRIFYKSPQILVVSSTYH